MSESYIRDSELKEKTEEELDFEIAKSIMKAKRELVCINRNYEYTSEPELIDYYLYEIKATQAKLDYLLKKAKKRNIMIDSEGELKARLSLEEAM